MIDDDVLPAARHLTGPYADAALGAVVEMAGGSLTSCRPTHVQYRPESDLVVQYTCEVAWGDGTSAVETLMASTTVHGVPPGTVAVEAESEEGSTLEVGVWRWPFDPSLPGLESAVVPRRAGEMLAGIAIGTPSLEVVAYRPTERAVVRVTDRRGELYVKLVPPHAVAAFVDRHERLGRAGLPVPNVLAFDQEAGWIALQALLGDTLRTRLKEGRRPWPPAAELLELTQRLASAELPHAAPVRSRVSDAIAHAEVLSTVAPSQRSRLDALTEVFGDAAVRAMQRRGPTVHGDLHEGQLVLAPVDADVTISGLLDIDDVGPGDPCDDLATILAHLSFRASTGRGDAAEIDEYVRALRSEFELHVDPGELRIVTAAVLVGLATGPFRIQSAGWEATVAEQLRTAEVLLSGR